MKLSFHLCVCVCVCVWYRSWCKNTSSCNSWSKISEKQWHKGKQVQHSHWPLPHCRCTLPCPSLRALIGLGLASVYISAHTQVYTHDPSSKNTVLSVAAQLFPPSSGRGAGVAMPMSWAHCLSGDMPPPDGHMSPQQILGKLFVKSQLAACLEVPGCKGLGLIKQPLMRHSRKLRPGRYSCAFLKCVCVLLIAHPGYQRKESGRGYWNQKNKTSKGIYSRFPKGKGVWPSADGKWGNKWFGCQMCWQLTLC